MGVLSYSSVPVGHDNGGRCSSTCNSGTLKLWQLNWIQPSLILLFVPVLCNYVKCLPWKRLMIWHNGIINGRSHTSSGISMCKMWLPFWIMEDSMEVHYVYCSILDLSLTNMRIQSFRICKYSEIIGFSMFINRSQCRWWSGSGGLLCKLRGSATQKCRCSTDTVMIL